MSLAANSLSRHPTSFGETRRQRAKASQAARDQPVGVAFRAEIHPTAASTLEMGQTVPYIHTFIRVAGRAGGTADELTAGILWTPPETIITPSGFEVPDDPELAAEVAAAPRDDGPRQRGTEAMKQADPIQVIALWGEGTNRGQCFLLRKRAGYSQEALSKLAMVSPDRTGTTENGRVTASSTAT